MHELGRAYGLSPMVVWSTFTFRQILRFFEIITNNKIEEWKMQAALHGVEIEGAEGKTQTKTSNWQSLGRHKKQ